MIGILQIVWLLPGLFLRSFVPWYFYEEPKHILKTYAAYAEAFLEVISIPFLLRTLLSPWKSITDDYPTNRLNIGALLQSLTLNITSRIIGLLFRIVALALGIVIQCVLLMFFTCYLLLWLLYPAVVVTALAALSSSSVL